MDAYIAQTLTSYVTKPAPPPTELKAITAGTITSDPPKPVILDDKSIKSDGDPSKYTLDGTGQMIRDEINKKLAAAARGERVDLSFLTTTATAGAKPQAFDYIKKTGNASLDAHHEQVFNQAISQGKTVEQAINDVSHDPIVFHLTGKGEASATGTQHGIDVDGAKDTKWAAKGDGVLAFGDKPIGTDGGKNADAYATLTAKAKEAGIDTSKGYLDASDIKTLESKGLTMMVSKGDGTNQIVKPSDLGITQMSLGGQSVHDTDSAGNTITTRGSFVRNGETGEADDMWLKNA
jgi:hypothetical protein